MSNSAYVHPMDALLTPTAAVTLRAPRAEGSRGAGRRARTRGLICAAANTLFVRHGFAEVTMDEIARAAEIRRSTLYTHFADKEQILAAIGEDYIVDVCAIVRRLDGPLPSTDRIAAWMEEFARFVEARPGPAELIVAIGHQDGASPVSAQFGTRMMRCFAERLTAFSRALEPGEDFRLAWAAATLSELSTALLFRARHGQGPTAKAWLEVAAMLFDRFIREER